MSETQAIDQSIAHQAEVEVWTLIRKESRRKLIAALTLGYGYVLAALAVGAFLILAVADVLGEASYMEGWATREFDLDWLQAFAVGYACLGVVATVGYLFALMQVQGWLPATMSRFFDALPWLGSTMRSVVLGEFFQAVYQSIVRSQTYVDAIENAARNVRHSGLTRWLRRAAKQLESGVSLSMVFEYSHLRDQPICAISALVATELSESQSVRVWHQAAAECHLLAQSRVDRAVQFVTVSCLLLSTIVALLALFLTISFMQVSLRGWMFW